MKELKKIFRVVEKLGFEKQICKDDIFYIFKLTPIESFSVIYRGGLAHEIEVVLECFLDDKTERTVLYWNYCGELEPIETKNIIKFIKSYVFLRGQYL